MNKIKLFSLSLVALFMACFTACESKYDVDHTAHIVGTWTYIGPNYAEALVIKEDGSVLSTGVENGEYWENVAGTIKIKGNVATMTFEDGDDAIGHIDVIPGIAFSIYEEDGEEWTFNYCANDLADEVIGMWVSNEGVSGMTIQTYQEGGKSIFTGFSLGANDYLTNMESTYKVVGNLMFQKTGDSYFATRLTYTPNGTAVGDILSTTATMLINGNYVTSTYSFLRVKESLNFTGQIYDYSAAYVSNAKGKDEDFNITGCTFNMANIKAGDFDMMFRSVLFCVEFPNATTMKQYFRPNGIDGGFETPITVEGNKVTLDMSAGNPAFRKVDMYMFQSANDSQLHVYMPTSSFINYFANLEITTMLIEGKIDTTDTAAVEKVFADMDARIESINVSWVFKARN